MAQDHISLPPPTMFGPKIIQQRTQPLQIYIQVPCTFAKYVMNQWDTVATSALIQLVSQEDQTDQVTNVEYLRVLDVQDQPIFTQKLSELKWGHLAGLTYELDTFHEDGALNEVYAVTFMNDQHVAQFNIKFGDETNRHSANADKLLPFLKPLTDAIERGEVTEAIKRFNFLCQFSPEQRKLKLVAETPLTAEEIKIKNTVNVNISVENYDGLEVGITLRVPKTASIGDLKEIMYTIYEIPLEVQKWLGEKCLYKNSEKVLYSTGEPKKIYLYILNADKVGLNRNDFVAKLESQRQNLKLKKETANQPQPQQQQPQQPQQPQSPSHEEDVPVEDNSYGPPLGQAGAQSYYNPQQQPYVPSPQMPPQEPADPNGEQPCQTIPNEIWGCPRCKYINPWECMRCERCRGQREEAI